MLTREQILSVEDIKTEEVHVPEWGGTVRVASMSGAARDRFELSCVAADGSQDNENIRAKVVAASVVDESGNLMFSAEDVEALGRKSAAALDRVFEASQRLSRISNADVEELAKN